MSRRSHCLSAFCALALIGPALLRAQAPTVGTADVIAWAQGYQEAGRYGDALILLQQAADVSPARSPAGAKALRLAAADVQSAWAGSLQDSSPAQSLSHYVAALDTDQVLRPADAADDLDGAGLAYGSLHQYGKAVDSYRRALALRRRLGDQSGQANTLNWLGDAYRSGGRYSQALDAYARALPLIHRYWAKNQEGETLDNMGAACESLRQYGRAAGFHRQALAAFRRAGDRDGEAVALGNLGDLYAGLHRYAEAAGFYRRALPLFRQIGDKEGEAKALGDMGTAQKNTAQKNVRTR